MRLLTYNSLLREFGPCALTRIYPLPGGASGAVWVRAHPTEGCIEVYLSTGRSGIDLLHRFPWELAQQLRIGRRMVEMGQGGSAPIHPTLVARHEQLEVQAAMVETLCRAVSRWARLGDVPFDAVERVARLAARGALA